MNRVPMALARSWASHWEWLKFKKVDEFVDLCRRDLAGQVEVMVRFIHKAGLAGALRARKWAHIRPRLQWPGLQEKPL